jgi:hypothetical protein
MVNTNEKSATIVGVLFIIATVTGILGVALTAPIINAPNYLSRVSANADQLTAGALLLFIMGAACAGIGISLNPILGQYHRGLALGAAVSGLLRECSKFSAAAASGCYCSSMLKTLDERFQDFLAQKRIAMAGVSHDTSRHPVSNLIYNRLRDTGHELFPVNPNMQAFEGKPWYPDVLSISGGVDGVVIITRREGQIQDIAGACPMMYGPEADFGHRCMRLML